MATFIVGAVVLLITVLAVRRIYRDKKNGNCCSSCSGGCSGCAKDCHTQQ